MRNAYEKIFQARYMLVLVHLLVECACLSVCSHCVVVFLLTFCWSFECGAVQNGRILFEIGNVFVKLGCNKREKRRRHALRTTFGRLALLSFPCFCIVSDESLPSGGS